MKLTARHLGYLQQHKDDMIGLEDRQVTIQEIIDFLIEQRKLMSELNDFIKATSAVIDTPLARRRMTDVYSEDARKRLREIGAKAAEIDIFPDYTDKEIQEMTNT